MRLYFAHTLPKIQSVTSSPTAGQPRNTNPWAEPDSATFGKWLASRLENIQNADVANLHYSNVARAYAHLYGMDVEGVGANAAAVTRSGDQGSIAELRIPVAASLLTKAWNVVVGPELNWSTVATSTDFANEAQSVTAKSGLQYYWNDIGIGHLAKKADFSSMAFGECVVHLPWDKTKGPDIALGPDGRMATEGDIGFELIPTWDVFRDPTARSWESLPVAPIRCWRNRYDLAESIEPMDGETPEEFETKKNAVRNATRDYSYWMPVGFNYSDTDLIPVFYAYHKRTPSVPTGRQVMLLSNGIVLADDDLDIAYHKVGPIYRIDAGEYDGTPYPYSKFFGILGAQQAGDSLRKDLLTSATGVSSNIISAVENTDLPVGDLGGGVKIVFRGKDDPKPEVLNLHGVNPEAYKLDDRLQNLSQQVMGLDSLTAGTFEGNVDLSGAAMALLTSTSVQNNSQLQAKWGKFVSDLGTGILHHIQYHMPKPRRIALAGDARSGLVTAAEISGPAVQGIERAQVTLGTALSQTDAFKLEFATMMVKGDGKTSWVQTPQQMQTVIDTGRADALTQDLSNELLLIASENEAIGKGQLIPVVLSDDHALHLKLHKSVASNLTARQQPQVIQALQDHENAHMKVLMETDPRLLQLMGQPAIGGAPGGPPASEMPPGGSGGDSAQKKAAEGQAAPPAPEAQAKQHGPSMPVNPATGQPAGPVAGAASPSLAVRPS